MYNNNRDIRKRVINKILIFFEFDYTIIEQVIKMFIFFHYIIFQLCENNEIYLIFYLFI